VGWDQRGIRQISFKDFFPLERDSVDDFCEGLGLDCNFVVLLDLKGRHPGIFVPQIKDPNNSFLRKGGRRVGQEEWIRPNWLCHDFGRGFGFSGGKLLPGFDQVVVKPRCVTGRRSFIGGYQDGEAEPEIVSKVL